MYIFPTGCRLQLHLTHQYRFAESSSKQGSSRHPKPIMNPAARARSPPPRNPSLPPFPPPPFSPFPSPPFPPPSPSPPSQVILSHTPFRTLVPTLGQQPVLAVGRRDYVAVAKAYGFEKVLTTYHLAAAFRDSLPFSSAQAITPPHGV